VPIVALQLLFINVVSDGIPGLFLSQEKADADIMKRQPLKKDAGLFSAGLGRMIASRSLLFIILTLTAFYIGRFVHVSDSVGASYEVGVSMAFIVLSWASVVNIFNVRSERSIFKIGFLSNKAVFFSAIGSIVVTLAVATIAPLMNVFDVVTLSGTHWLIVALLTSLQLIIVEIIKAVKGNK